MAHRRVSWFVRPPYTQSLVHSQPQHRDLHIIHKENIMSIHDSKISSVYSPKHIGQHSPLGTSRISPSSHTGLKQDTAEQSTPGTQTGQHSPSGTSKISPFSHTGLRQNTTEQSIPVGGHMSVVTHLLLTVSMTCPGGQVHPCTHRVMQIWLGSESQVLGHGDAQSLKT